MFDLQGMCRSPAFAFAVGSSKLKAASYERGSVLDGEIDTSKNDWYVGSIITRLASNIAKYVAQWLFSNIYIVGSCEHFNFLIHQLIPDFIWAPSKDSFSKTIQACFENSLKTIQSDKDGAQMKSGIS